ncbi:hypothetical protein INT47_005905 [Mucor saturninus]|uniref:F-box domain-containing protein n=1 Tax=Mucor saturninus TaxID=64648 RepID=A0A8H7R9F0_9FUNG|nr:hypothetical protein INT47_005905 [Mucor saturninus]
MSTENVPKEVLVQVFSLLERKDIYTLMYVCKQWYTAAVQLYFQKIRIKEKHIKVDKPFIHGYLTREFTLYREYVTSNHVSPNHKLDEPDFLLLLSSLPNLEKLDFQFCIHTGHYISILRQLPDTDLYLQRIKEIAFHSKYPEEHVSHFLVCYSFRKSIKRLETDVNNNDLMLASSKSLFYYLPRFTCLTQLTYNCQQGNDTTLFDILLCCENIVDFKYSSRYPIPSRANSQVGTTSNKHLKRLTINSPINETAYVDYLRVIQPLIYLNLTIQQDGYELFRLIEPFVEELQKFKDLRIRFDYGRRPSLSLSQTKTNTFYNVLVKLKGNRDLLYDATFDFYGWSSKDFVTVREDKLSFSYVMDGFLYRNFVDKEGIIKNLRFTRNRFSLSEILEYAKTFPRHETLSIEFVKNVFFQASKVSITMNCFRPSQTLFNQLYDYLPDAETISLKQARPQKNIDFGTTWDLTAFKSLNEFNFHIDHIYIHGYSFVFLKFDYGDLHCYQRACYFNDVKKDLHFTVKSSLEELDSRVFIATIKVHSTLVEINCVTSGFYTLTPCPEE